ncbi:YceI family protein [Flavivirga eckloniae]|uniref:Lipid-binding protein n=1 Tax=Flavivirga eckloniae TaxID=1803846 RepID=A0A2K9PQF8_9FLAO|nr:YceI family protein [Flavivirga eckloniae]AUP79279.1 lipid-binding protein [Flavivirga eckloniae]
MKKIILLATIICFTVITNAQELIKTNINKSAVEWTWYNLFEYNKDYNIVNTTKIDTNKSVVKWSGSNLFKYNKHYGTVKFVKGHIIKFNDVIQGGAFEIDMNSIVNTDGKYNEMLVDHLKNQDFFDVEKYPTAAIKFTEVVHKDATTIKVKAKLTIKGVTNDIDFNMTSKVIDGMYEMHSKFIIDRTRWGIEYESKGMIGSVKDGIISDAIEFEVVLQLPIRDRC